MADLPYLDTALDWVSSSFAQASTTVGVWLENAQANGGQWAATGLTSGEALLAQAMTLNIPVPDTALVVAFALASYALYKGARQSRKKDFAETETLYQSELLAANRRAQQLKGELRKAEQQIERERQKRRREATRAQSKQRSTHLAPVSAVAKSA